MSNKNDFHLKDDKTTGLSGKYEANNNRLLNRDGSFNVEKKEFHS